LIQNFQLSFEKNSGEGRFLLPIGAVCWACTTKAERLTSITGGVSGVRRIFSKGGMVKKHFS